MSCANLLEKILLNNNKKRKESTYNIGWAGDKTCCSWVFIKPNFLCMNFPSYHRLNILRKPGKEHRNSTTTTTTKTQSNTCFALLYRTDRSNHDPNLKITYKNLPQNLGDRHPALWVYNQETGFSVARVWYRKYLVHPQLTNGYFSLWGLNQHGEP